MKKMTFVLSAYDMPYEDETDEILKKSFSKEDIMYLKNSAEKLNLHCLQWISEESMTFFNSKQSYEIEIHELPFLREEHSINKKLLEHIEKITFVIRKEGYYFMKIEPENIQKDHKQNYA